MSQLTTDLIRNNERWVLKLVGNLDSDTSHLMWCADSSTSLLKELTQAGVRKLCIDLTATESVDSQGLRLLLNAHKEFSKEEIQIILQNPNSHLRRLFRIMQFDRIFVIEANE